VRVRAGHVAIVVLAVLALAGSALAVVASDPKVALDRQGQARARALLILRTDVGRGWRGDPVYQVSSQLSPVCPGYSPDLSSLVITGRADSKVFRLASSGTEQDVTTAVFVFRSAAQAKRMHTLTGVRFARHCLHVGSVPGGKIDEVSALRLPASHVDAIGWRVRLVRTSAPKLLYADYVFLHAKAASVAVFFVSTNRPFPAAPEKHVLQVLRTRMSA